YYRFCDEHGLKYYPSQTNFVFIDFGIDGNEVFQYLLERGVIVRSGRALGLPTGVRVTIGTKEQNDRVFETIASMLREKQLA
ncbi:aminotransferase class I/II-fold pyridoxal phosphate-dependent enzyme, partial [Anoxybacillus geothermalis]|nr:aminotransferase class I/II-fold pyridoxal phosphate-dependent enzyme [Anoxybacillus geothermalis]